jgi:drug/metabolite transporter (DMT)-like permease
VAPATPEVATPEASRSGSGPPLLFCSLFVISAGTIALKKAYENGSVAVELAVSQQVTGGVLALLLLPRALRGGLSRRQWACAAAAGATLAVSNVAAFEGFARLPAAILLIFLYSSPLWVAIGQAVFLRTPPTRNETIAVCLAVAGVAVMVGSTDSHLDLAGVALGLLSGILFATTLLLAKPLDSVPLSASVVLPAAGLVAFVIWPGAGVSGLAEYPHMPWAVAVGVLFWLWMTLLLAGQRHTSPMAAVVVSAVEPAIVAVLAYLLLSESLGVRELAGGAILLGGALLAMSDQHRPRRA